MQDDICSVEGCGGSPIMARGWCKAHYRRWYRDRETSNDTRPPKRGREVWNALNEEEDRTGYRICTRCKERKPVADFKHIPRGRNGRHANCDPCRLEAARRTNRIRTERASEQEIWRDSRERYLRRKYGMTIAEYDRLLTEQEGACAACGRVVDLVVDHCHTRGTVRALLCHNCNISLGLMRDDPSALAGLITYLERHRAS
jgi:hypothetical protein